MNEGRKARVFFRHDFDSQPRLNKKQLERRIQDHKAVVVPVLRENDLYYRNRNVELTNEYLERAYEGVTPNNYVPTSYPGYITRFLAGYIDAPGYTDYESVATDNGELADALSELNRQNYDDTLQNELGFEMHKHGYAWELVYLERATGDSVFPRCVSIPVEQVIPIYTKSEHKTIGAVIRVWVEIDDDTNLTRERVSVYYSDVVQHYTGKAGSLVVDEPETAHGFTSVPWVEYRNNRDYWPSWWCVKTEIDVLDALKTNSINSLTKFEKSVLMTSLRLSEEQLEKVGRWSVLDGMSKDDFAQYLKPNLEPELTEYMIQHFTDEIHKITGIPDITKEKIGADSQSGVARKMALYPLRISVQEHVAYKQQAIRRRISLLLEAVQLYNVAGVDSQLSDSDASDIKVHCRENLPADIEGVARENQLLGNTVSQQWKVNRIPGAEWEVERERLAEERGLSIELMDSLDNG